MQYFAWGMSCCALMVEHYLELYYLKSLGVWENLVENHHANVSSYTDLYGMSWFAIMKY
jgi:hypothetical protein